MRKQKQKNTKLLPYIFCEGETEEEYAKWIKSKFKNVLASVEIFKKSFCDVDKMLNKDSSKLKKNIDVVDEIWFFFDIDQEQGDIGKWEERKQIIKKIRKQRKGNHIKVRLLMTTGCIEYWFLLHYKKEQPPIQTSADKDRILRKLRAEEASYRKGDKTSIEKISIRYKDALENGKWSINQLRSVSEPLTEKEDDINEWLYTNERTFSNVHEAIEMLMKLENELAEWEKERACK